MRVTTSRFFTSLFLATVAMTSFASDIPLSNWSAPASWRPARGEMTAMVDAMRPLPLVAVNPCRLYDSRDFTILTGGTSRSIVSTTPPTCGVPAGIEGVSINITAFGSTATGSYGFVTVYPTGTTRPNVSSMNFLSGSQTSNFAVVAVDGSDQFDIYTTTTTHFTIDVNGYYTESQNVGQYFEVSGSQAGGGMIFAQNFDNANNSAGVNSFAHGTGMVYGVRGTVPAGGASAAGVRGLNQTASANAYGVQGVIQSTTPGTFAAGVRGENAGTGGNGIGVWGSQAGTGWGVFGNVPGTSNGAVGVLGMSSSTTFTGGETAFGPVGVLGIDNGNGTGVFGVSREPSGGESGNFYRLNAANAVTSYVELGWAAATAARFFGNVNINANTSGGAGNLSVAGSLSKGSGTFKIDHPLDPENKYLYHSFVESPDMMNIYNGVVTLDSEGFAAVVLPEYFQALNREFRYQLTSIGRPQPNLYIQSEVDGNSFTIAGGKANARVSWMVTGVRQDKFADAHRVVAEVEKPEMEKGTYLHADEWGVGRDKSVFTEAVQSKVRDAESKAAAEND